MRNKLLLNLPFVTMLSLPVSGAEKLTIESPVQGQRFASGHAVVVVKIEPSIERVKVTVTLPAAKPSSSATGTTAAAGGPRTIFTGGPIELPRGANHRSPDVRLASGENTITISDADDDKTSAAVTVTADNSDMSSDTRKDFEGTPTPVPASTRSQATKRNSTSDTRRRTPARMDIRTLSCLLNSEGCAKKAADASPKSGRNK